MTRLLLAAGIFAVFATPAAATPLNWDFRGLVTSAVGQSDFPVGTPVTFNWYADPAAPNQCAASDPAVGIYFNQHVTERIGAAFYDITGILTVGTNVSRGCMGPPDSNAELRLVSWAGPNLSDGTPLVPFFPCCQSPALLWTLAGGAYPLAPPRTLFFQGPIFINGAGVSGIVEAVPEPATWSLVALGAVRLRKRRKAACVPA